ncbi:MAG: DnaD domain protein [Clostridiales bacterium]|nr:DnaD domain protein [Clostridiales bacterium]
MKEKKYVLPPPESITISGETADKLIKSANPAAALLYLYILKNGGELSLGEAGAKLKLGDAVYSALSELKNLGLVASEPIEITEREDVPPEYTAEDIEMSVNSGSAFGPLVKEIQHRLGKVLSGGDLIIFFGIYDYLGMPAEVIALLVSYCTEQYANKHGAGRKPSARMIEKEAYTWVRKEIFTLDAAEEYIRKQNEMDSRSNEVKSMLRIKNRGLSPTEEKYIFSWLEMGFEPEALAIAYDRTVVNTGELSWAYMNSIIKNWHNKGLRSPADILAGDVKSNKNRKIIIKEEKKDEKKEMEQISRFLEKMKQS